MSNDSPISIFGMSLLRASRVWRQETSQFLQASHGLSEAEALPMIAMQRLEDGVTQTALADYVGISTPSLVRTIDSLVAQGWVTRQESPSDRRAKTLWFTSKGRKKIDDLDDALMSIRTQLLQSVEMADIEACLRVFRAIEATATTPSSRT